jgi:hypothetical protein
MDSVDALRRSDLTPPPVIGGYRRISGVSTAVSTNSESGNRPVRKLFILFVLSN